MLTPVQKAQDLLEIDLGEAFRHDRFPLGHPDQHQRPDKVLRQRGENDGPGADPHQGEDRADAAIADDVRDDVDDGELLVEQLPLEKRCATTTYPVMNSAKPAVRTMGTTPAA